MLIRVVLVVVLVLAAASAGPAEPVSAPRPDWTRLGELAEPPPNPWSAGWDDGYLLAAGVPGAELRVLTSEDGLKWRSAPPEGITVVIDAAGYGDAGYLLGSTADDIVLWRTEDGVAWQAFPLGTGPATEVAELPVFALAAGPRGVLVVGSGPVVQGVHRWYSPDGRSFDTIRAVSDLDGLVPSHLVATPRGFLLSIGDSVLSSPDGAAWTDLDLGSEEVLASAGTATDEVAVTGLLTGGTTTWYRRGGRWRTASVDPGALPDLGVVPADKRETTEVLRWGSGFVAVGRAQDLERDVGVAWTSADGSWWQRIPLHGNGLDGATSLDRIIVGGRGVLLFGTEGVDSSTRTVVWRADPPPVERTAPPPARAPADPLDPERFDAWAGIPPRPTAEGSCVAPSYVARRPDAYQCQVGDRLLDPCVLGPRPTDPRDPAWATPLVACVALGSTLVVRTGLPLPVVHAVVAVPHPWRLELAGGDICTETVDRVRPESAERSYACVSGATATYLWEPDSAPHRTALTSTDGTEPTTPTTVTALYR
ncbi:hypothetical protein [Actinosynnema sp. NPDC020468]|uniref:hypothetical protein n=1 Tax=Actinosynnema sp. NPDC020468 TaxID=3154488 RepID=UPI0033F40D64